MRGQQQSIAHNIKLFSFEGNHESINMNQMYGFTGEVTAKYS